MVVSLKLKKYSMVQTPPPEKVIFGESSGSLDVINFVYVSVRNQEALIFMCAEDVHSKIRTVNDVCALWGHCDDGLQPTLNVQDIPGIKYITFYSVN